MKRIHKKDSKNRLVLIISTLFIVVIMIICCFSPKIISDYNMKKRVNALGSVEIPNWITEDIIDIHDHARTGVLLTKLNEIVVHYVGNPGTTAKQNRDYFNNKGTDVSSHFIVGLEGEILQCLPLNEISAASNHRNVDTISIEVCHPNDDGKFNEITYNSLIRLLTWLLYNFDLETEDIIRHYDVSGKLCPIYYVENPSEWEKLLEEVNNTLNDTAYLDKCIIS